MIRAIETALMSVGVICLLVFGVHSWSQAWVADKLMADFSSHAAGMADTSGIAGAGTAPEGASIAPGPASPESNPAFGVDANTIDQSNWSDTRRRAFRERAAAANDVMGILAIPALKLKAPILVGIDDAALDSGVGWLDRTAVPGDYGNAAIAGHRDSFFRSLGTLGEGDEIVVETADSRFTYTVSNTSVVDPSDVSVLAAEPGGRVLTLITCYPFYFVGPAPNRYIVRADLAAAEARP